MRKIVVALSLTTLAFAGTTVYFARELARERSRAASLDHPAQTSPEKALLPQLPLSRPAADKKPGSAPAAMPESEEARMNKVMAEYNRRFLRTLEDPQLRQDQLVQYKMMMRMQLPRVAQILGMSAEESDRFFELLALQQSENQERHVRCNLEPGCQPGSLEGPPPREKEIADFLGPERHRQYQEYQRTMMERESVSALRSRLSDATYLSEDKAESLIAALADEKRRMQAEAVARGTELRDFGVATGRLFASADEQSLEAHYESAQANSKRLRQRAAELLTPEQLRVFNEMQDELLVSLRARLRAKEVAEAAAN